jgi:hypothetical protein
MLHDSRVQPMSGDEVFVTIVSTVLALIGWSALYARWARFSDYRLPKGAAAMLLLLLPISAALLYWLLRTLASHDVREDWRYLAQYSAMGLAWIRFAPTIFLPGISLRDDFFERRNSSACFAFVGFTIASLLCFCGGNIGDGPGWWVVVFCAILANATLWALWVAAAHSTRVVDFITIDRDPAIGLRLAGFFIGCGLILGRAVAGDWVSADATIGDFVRKAWPVLILLAIYIVSERFAKPRFHRDEQAPLGRGVVPALFYILLGLVPVLAQGRIE